MKGKEGEGRGRKGRMGREEYIKKGKTSLVLVYFVINTHTLIQTRTRTHTHTHTHTHTAYSPIPRNHQTHTYAHTHTHARKNAPLGH